MRVTQSATRLGSLPSLLRLRQSPRRLRPALRPLAPDWPPLPSALSSPTQGPENLQTQICLAPSPAHTSIQENTPSPQWGSHSHGPHHPSPSHPQQPCFSPGPCHWWSAHPPGRLVTAWSSPLPHLHRGTPLVLQSRSDGPSCTASLTLAGGTSQGRAARALPPRPPHTAW